jgi:hypothetical protein
MADEYKPSGGIGAGMAHAAAALAHTPLPYLLGMALMLTGIKWDGHLHDQKGCFQLQEVKGVIYKVDTCSGKTEELKPVAVATSKAEAASAIKEIKTP